MYSVSEPGSVKPWNVHSFSCRYKTGPGSSVGIATDYGLDGPRSNPGWGRDFPLVQTSPGAHPASCKMGTGSFQRVKYGPGRAADHSAPSSAAVMEE